MKEFIIVNEKEGDKFMCTICDTTLKSGVEHEHVVFDSKTQESIFLKCEEVK